MQSAPTETQTPASYMSFGRGAKKKVNKKALGLYMDSWCLQWFIVVLQHAINPH